MFFTQFSSLADGASSIYTVPDLKLVCYLNFIARIQRQHALDECVVNIVALVLVHPVWAAIPCLAECPTRWFAMAIPLVRVLPRASRQSPICHGQVSDNTMPIAYRPGWPRLQRLDRLME